MDLAKRTLIFALILISQASCSSAVVIREPEARIYADPTYEDSKEFFFLGILGPEHRYSDKELCLGRDIDQLETVYADTDVLVAIFTLGVYSPRTLRVWCKL